MRSTADEGLAHMYSADTVVTTRMTSSNEAPIALNDGVVVLESGDTHDPSAGVRWCCSLSWMKLIFKWAVGGEYINRIEVSRWRCEDPFGLAWRRPDRKNQPLVAPSRSCVTTFRPVFAECLLVDMASQALKVSRA
ncbi:hypothetical protein DVH05_007776 [Phytophthora capsici]|nr:hypothetical protein DVH05_007776 [Phytophthora capsici]